MNKTNSVISLAETITKSECILADSCIAPGTEGVFNIVINAEGSGVNIDYEVNLIKEENTPSNLYFFTKKENTEEKYSTLAELFSKEHFKGSFEIGGEKIKVYEIFWKWPFENFKEDGTVDESKDLDDLNFAKAQTDYIFEIEISGKQSISF